MRLNFMLKATCVILFLQVFQFYSYGVCTSSDDEEIVMIPSNHSSNPRPHNKDFIPFEVSYSSEFNSVSVRFLKDIGQVDILIKNESSGESNNYAVDSRIGMTVLPILNASVCYTIAIYLPNGKEYIGEFIMS